MFKPALASLLLVGALPAAGQSYIEDFSTFTSSLNPGDFGGDFQQTTTASVAGNDLTVTIVTGDTPGNPNDPAPSAAQFYGGGFQTVVTDPIAPGNFTSTDESDYFIEFDLSASASTFTRGTIFLKFRTEAGADVAGQYSVGHNNNANLAAGITSAFAGNTAPVSINLADFFGGPATLPDLSTVGEIQFALYLTANDAAYEANSAANTFTVDNLGVRVIPEPASAALLAGGALCLIARRRRTA